MDHSTAPPINKRNKIGKFFKKLAMNVPFFNQEKGDAFLSETSQLQFHSNTTFDDFTKSDLIRISMERKKVTRRTSAAVDDDGNRGWSIGRIVIIVLISLAAIGGIEAIIQNYNRKTEIQENKDIIKKVISPKVTNGIYDPIVDEEKAPQRVRVSFDDFADYRAKVYAGEYVFLEETNENGIVKRYYKKSIDDSILWCETKSERKECEISSETYAEYSIKIRRYDQKYKNENERTFYGTDKNRKKISGTYTMTIDPM